MKTVLETAKTPAKDHVLPPAAAARWEAVEDATAVAQRHVAVDAHQLAVEVVVAIVAVVVAAAVAVTALPHVVATAAKDAVAAASPTVPRPVPELLCKVAPFVQILAVRIVPRLVQRPVHRPVAMVHVAAIVWGRAAPLAQAHPTALQADVLLQAATIVVPIPATPNVLGHAT